MRVLKPILATALFAGLSACGGGGGTSSSTAPSATEFANAINADRAKIGSIAGDLNTNPVTPAIPVTASNDPALVSGDVNYTGPGLVLISVTPTRAVAMRGDAEVDVNFATGVMGGSITDIVAADAQNSTPVLVDEDITLAGSINNATQNTFNLTYQGNPEVDGTTYALNGTIPGEFRGTGAASFSAISNSETVTSSAGGATLNTGVLIVGERP